MNSKAIIKEVKNILEKDKGLSYMQKIFVGDRQAINMKLYPCIIIESKADTLTSVLKGNIQENNLALLIIPAVSITDREKSLIGDETTKGLEDVIFDIKTAIYSKYPTLNHTCFYFNLSVSEKTDFPDLTGKYAIIEMNIIYREQI